MAGQRVISSGREESAYFREEVKADFMKFAFENKNKFEESKRIKLATAALEQLDLQTDNI